MTRPDSRLDWMLLLPAGTALPADDVIVIGGDDEMGDGLVAGGLARRWRRPASADDAAPIVVAWAGANETAANIARHVAPGGVAVVQRDRRQRHGGPRGSRGQGGQRGLGALRRRLAANGCPPVSTHLVLPNFEHPQRYVPVDRGAGLRWYVRRLFVARSLATRLVRLGLLAVTSVPHGGRWSASFARRTVTIASRSTFRTPPPPLGAVDGRPGDTAIVLTSGYDAGSRSVLLPFVSGATAPATVVKVATGPATAEGTGREHQRLQQLHAALDDELCRSLPVPVDSASVLGRLACRQSCAEGPGMSASSGRVGFGQRRARHDLRVVARWLDRFAIATATTHPAEAWTSVFHDLIAEVHVPDHVRLLLERAAVAAAETGFGAGAVQQHYDTGPWNVHIAGDRPFLVDWESDHLRSPDAMGPPLADVLYLATYWYFATVGIRAAADEPAAVVRLFAQGVPADSFVQEARATIDRSLAALGLQRQCVPVALTALWAERALYTERRRHSQQSLNGTVGGGPQRAVDAPTNMPLVYLDALANAGMGQRGGDDWWSYPVGTRLIVTTATSSPGVR